MSKQIKATDDDLKKIYEKMNSRNDESSLRGVKMKLSKFKMSKLKSSSDQGTSLSKEEQEALSSGTIRIAASRSRFSLKSDKFQTVKPKMKSSGTPLPENWNNYTAPSDDPDNIKYKLSTRPMNQQRCGSCFACACATTINDVFVFGKNLNYNPDLSPMAIMSCIPDTDGNSKCDGGNPIQVLASLSKNGVTSNRCIDYNSICDASDHCKNNGQGSPSEMKIPECGGCFTKACNKPVKRNKYFIKKPTYISISDGYDEESNEIPGNKNGVQIIKEHLYKFGSAVSGFAVFKNFMNDSSNGEFKDTHGVYIESESYGVDADHVHDFLGCHAIVVVGWGVESRPIKLKSGVELHNTPYWVVRNTWGTVWGLNGYFKIAMYQEPSKANGDTEINPNTSLERFRFYSPPDGGTVPVGGIVLVEPKNNLDEAIVEYTEQPRTLEPLPEDIIKYYCSDAPTMTSSQKDAKDVKDVKKDLNTKNSNMSKEVSKYSKDDEKDIQKSSSIKLLIAIAAACVIIYMLYRYIKRK